MSCYVVSEEHISCLIATALYGPIDTEKANKLGRFHPLSFGQPRETLDLHNAFKLGRLMLEANVKSVEIHDFKLGHLMLEAEQSGDSARAMQFYESYKFPLSPVPAGNVRRLTVVQALKALQCFEYQCDTLLNIPVVGGVLCEANLVATVKNVIDDLRRNLVQVLPGYEEAKWVL
jgi:hypothetical protein